jgi:DNA-directed RNA polymerase delta subunit
MAAAVIKNNFRSFIFSEICDEIERVQGGMAPDIFSEIFEL